MFQTHNYNPITNIKGKTKEARHEPPSKQYKPESGTPQETGQNQGRYTPTLVASVVGGDVALEIVRALRETVDVIRVKALARNEGNDTQSFLIMREFFRSNPPKFTGELGLVKVDNWLEQVTKVLDIG